MLKPLGTSFLFEFFNDSVNGMFVQRNKGVIAIAHASLRPEEQGKAARWGKVLAIGDRVKDFAVGDTVLIAPGKWTPGFTHEGVRQWRSVEEEVLAIGEDESVAFDY